MGYKPLRVAKPGLDSPIGGQPPLQLDTPVTISFTGFIGISARVQGFHNRPELPVIIDLGLLSPITIGSMVAHGLAVQASDIRWVNDQGYVIELNGDTQVTPLPGGFW